MSEPVKPETRGRNVDENFSGKRRASPGPRSQEGAPQPTPPDTRQTSLDAALTAPPRPASTPPVPAPQPPPPPQPPPGATMPPTTGSGQQRVFVPLDPDVRPQHETSGPKSRPEPAPESSGSAARTKPPKKARTSVPPMWGAIGALAVIGIALFAAIVPSLAGRVAVRFAAPVPGMAAAWGGAHEDARVQQYVSRVANKLAAAAPAVGRVSLVVTRDPNAHALALPGKEILVSAGLLRRLSSEAQLGAVLAHLIAHMEAGDVDRAYDAATGDEPTRARAAALSLHGAERERKVTPRAAELVRAAGYESAAFVDAFANLGAKSGRVSSFVQQHPVPPDLLQTLRDGGGGGRGADADYARFALDPLGRSAVVATEPSANPPLPPKPPPTPKPDLTRPGETKRPNNPAPPRKNAATSEPPAVPL